MNVDAVTRLIEETGHTLVMPRFRKLAAHEIESKSADRADLVTVVDKDVEVHLTRELKTLDSDAAVIGEEATFLAPQLLDLVRTDRSIWIIDPIDGTKNFATGDDRFGIMVSYVTAGVTRAAWVVLPARNQTFVAEAGSGAWMNGGPLRVPETVVARKPTAALHLRYMPDGLNEVIAHALTPHVAQPPASGCSAIEYTNIATGTLDFAMYYRLLPWDHAAPALILTEAGGAVVHTNGDAYTPRSRNQPTVVARNGSIADRVRGWIG